MMDAVDGSRFSRSGRAVPLRNVETAAFAAVLLVGALSCSAGAAIRGDGFAIVGARVFTGATDSERHEDWTVVVLDGRLVAVGPRATVDVPADLRVVDGRGRTVLPGYVDLHVHLFGSGGRFDRPVDVDPIMNAEAAGAFGVTTQLDLNAPEDRLFDAFASARARVPGAPRVLFAGAAISAPGGHGTEGGFPARTVSDPAGARREVRGRVTRGAHVVKLVVDGGGWADVPRVPTLDDQTIAAAIAAAHELDRKVIVHVIDVERARAVVLAGADALAHLPLEGALDDDFVALLADRGTVVVPTLAVYESQFGWVDDPTRLDAADVRSFVPTPVRDGFADVAWRSDAVDGERTAWFRERWSDALARLSRLHSAGVPLLPGTDAGSPGTFHGDALHREFAAWVEAGVPPGEVLHAATLGAAGFLGLDDRIGTVAVGKDADLVLVDGDPTADIAAARRVVMVAVAGRLLDRETLSRRIATAAAVPGERRRVVADFESDPPEGGRFEVRLSRNAADREASARRLEDGAVGNPTVFVRVEGDVRLRAPSGGFAGVRIPLDQADAAECAGYVGIRFRARAESRRTLRVLVATDPVTDGDHHGAKCVVGPAWHAYHVPFDALRQVGHGRRVRFSADQVTGIELLTEAGDDGPFRFDVDDLELYR